MKKLKNEQQLLKMAISVGETYAKNRGYDGFSQTMGQKEKVEIIYRLLVNDKLITALGNDSEDLLSMKHRLAVWIKNKLPANHALLK
ncbi:DUF5062 family protein [Aliiglaciecola lipolytica]|uniref:DUF5062 domain-containing protein n=1 Tax=Aliiglaciecola lipolytica E3 TaxID=1127673 RepID=K6Y865_9ALTE|nr:DUF5062 family protein [Aliiglaciecola lipolytica]GAC14392.1 hypothetical protein GLIP_1759 [Aliiglaciecola lipolytica E3]